MTTILSLKNPEVVMKKIFPDELFDAGVLKILFDCRYFMDVAKDILRMMEINPDSPEINIDKICLSGYINAARNYYMRKNFGGSIKRWGELF